jgi:hypothetical protein
MMKGFMSPVMPLAGYYYNEALKSYAVGTLMFLGTLYKSNIFVNPYSPMKAPLYYSK